MGRGIYTLYNNTCLEISTLTFALTKDEDGSIEFNGVHSLDGG